LGAESQGVAGVVGQVGGWQGRKGFNLASQGFNVAMRNFYRAELKSFGVMRRFYVAE